MWLLFISYFVHLHYLEKFVNAAALCAHIKRGIRGWGMSPYRVECLFWKEGYTIGEILMGFNLNWGWGRVRIMGAGLKELNFKKGKHTERRFEPRRERIRNSERDTEHWQKRGGNLPQISGFMQGKGFLLMWGNLWMLVTLKEVLNFKYDFAWENRQPFFTMYVMRGRRENVGT